MVRPCGGTATGALLQATRTVPIVFAIVPDPIGSGFVASLSRPGGNPRLLAIRIWLQREMVRSCWKKEIQAGPDASSGPAELHCTRRRRPVGRYPIPGYDA